MNHLATIFRCTILVFFLQYLLTTFDHRFIPLGELTVEPASPVLLGSSLTIYCSIQKFQHLNEWFDILLELNGETVNKWNRVNQTTMTFTVPSVRRPKSTALCKLKTDRWPQVVGELQIQAGLPPDRPKNIICLTTRSSEAVNCSWSKGQQTHITTYYNVTISRFVTSYSFPIALNPYDNSTPLLKTLSVCRSNWTQVHSDVIQDSGEVSIGKGLLDVNTTYMLTITGYNQLGESAQSDPFPFCLQDIVIPETPKITRVEFERDSTAVMLLWKTAEFSEDLRPYIRLRTHNETWLDAEGVGIHQNLTEVENIRPLTEYEFQLKTCMITLFVKHIYTTSCTNRTNTSEMCVCSRWSSSEWKTSPGKGPSQQLDVWRTFSGTGTNGRKEVTVLWKADKPRKKTAAGDTSEMDANVEAQQASQASADRGGLDASMRDCIRETMTEMTANVTKAIDEKLAPLLELLKKQGDMLENHGSRLNKSERRIAALEDAADLTNAKVATLEKTVNYLAERVDDLENRGRRKNVLIVGLSEGTEGTDPTRFFERWLPEVLHIDAKEGRLKLERAHRTLGPKPLTSQRPRPVLVRFHNYQDKQRVMNASREMGRKNQAVKHAGNTVMFFQDLSAAVICKRKGYNAVKNQLRSLGAEYRQLYPVLLKITFRGSSKVFDSPEEAQRFADSLRGKPVPVNGD
uniref:Interleukin-12 receptor subunit beta-2-like n=1 Tax=Gouania willdenowi TaxID=441366 RepID=A0A8C5DRR6_GOUWI